MDNALRTAGWLALLVTSVCVFTPLNPYMPSAGLDPSWVFALNEATARDMAFGKDILFTHGPFVPIYTRTYHPGTDLLMVSGSLILAITNTLVIWRTCNRDHWLPFLSYLLLMIGLLSGGGPVRDVLLYSYPLWAALWATQSLGKHPGETVREPHWAALIVFLPFGLLPLIKGTLLIACAGVMTLTLTAAALDRRWSLAIIAAVVPPAAMALFWVSSGQSIQDLPAFISSLFLHMSAYTESASLFGRNSEIVAFVMAAAVLLLAVYRLPEPSFRGRLFLSLSYAALLFLTFKGGFVRHDGHAIIAGTFLLVAALALTMVSRARSPFVALITAVLVWGFIQSHYFTRTSPGKFFQDSWATYANAAAGLHKRLSGSQTLQDEFHDNLQRLKRESGFPKINGTTDIYSFEQSYLIASGNEWNPRPMFQSLTTFTPYHAERNRDHLLGPAAPDNLFFKIAPIDGRIPAIEDGASWPILLARYEPIRFIKDHLLLAGINTTPINPFDESSPVRFSVRLGETVLLPGDNRPVYAKIRIKPSFPGKLSALLFKPSPLRIRLKLKSGETRIYRLIAGMAESGLLISPAIDNTREFAALFKGAEFLAHKQVQSLIIEPTFGRFLWNDVINIEFSPLDLPRRAGIEGAYDAPITTGSLPDKITVGPCIGHVDGINGSGPGPKSFSAIGSLDIRGWMIESINPPRVLPETLVYLKDATGQSTYFRTRRLTRPDVGQHFGQPSLASSGFESNLDVSEWDGAYTIGLAHRNDTRIRNCSNLQVTGQIEGLAASG